MNTVIEYEINSQGLDQLIERAPWDAIVYRDYFTDAQVRRIAHTWPLGAAEKMARQLADAEFEDVALQFPATAFAAAPERFSPELLSKVQKAAETYQTLTELEWASRKQAQKRLDETIRPAYLEQVPAGSEAPVVTAWRKTTYKISAHNA